MSRAIAMIILRKFSACCSSRLREVDLADLGDAVDERRRSRSPKIGSICGERRERVLDGVVQQAGRDARHVEPQVGDDARDLERVRRGTARPTCGAGRGAPRRRSRTRAASVRDVGGRVVLAAPCATRSRRFIRRTAPPRRRCARRAARSASDDRRPGERDRLGSTVGVHDPVVVVEERVAPPRGRASAGARRSPRPRCGARAAGARARPTTAGTPSPRRPRRR